MAFCSSRSPGSETCDHFDSLSREATLAASAPAGSWSAPASSLCAAARPLSEPATATHRVFVAPAGTVT